MKPMADDSTGNGKLGKYAIPATGALALLFFHPGAMDMDRLKFNLLLCIMPVMMALCCGIRPLCRLLSTPLPRGLALAGLVPLLLMVSSLFSRSLYANGIALTAGLIAWIGLAQAAGVQARKEPLKIPAWLLGAGALAGAYGLLQAVGVDPFYLHNPNREAVSTLGNTNETGEVMALLLPVALAFSFHPARGARLLGGICLPFIMAALWVSGSRGGALAGGCACLLCLYLVLKASGTDQSGSRRWIAPGLAVAVGLALAGLMGSGQSLAFKNIESDASIFSAEYPTNKIRIETWKSTLHMIKDQPIFGAGAARFRTAYPPYRNPEEARIPGLMGARTEVTDPHNEYLWAAAEGGVLAGLALLAFLLWLLRRSVGAARRAGRAASGASHDPDHGQRADQACLAAGLSGTVLAFLVVSLFRSPLHNPAAALILFLAAGQIEGSWGSRVKAMIPVHGKLPAPIMLLLLLAVSLWFGGLGLASDWLAASVGVQEKIDPAAFRTLQRAADLDPANLDINNYVGQLAGNRLMGTSADKDGRYTREAEERLYHVLTYHPYHPGALKTLARVLACMGRYAEALELLTAYLRVTGEEGAPEELLVFMLEEAGRYKEAGALYLDVPTLGAGKLFARGKALIEGGNPKGAVLYIDHYLQQYPLDGDGLALFAKSLKELHGEGHKEAYRRMHIAYALDWMEAGDWRQAERSLNASLRYGKGEGEADLLSAIVEEGKGGDFRMPDNPITGNKAVIDRLKKLGRSGKLPGAAAGFVSGIAD